MALSYDFDIHWIIPESVLGDPSIAKLMGDIGFEPDARCNYVALFRDPRTAARVKGADPEFRAWLEASGFGFNTYDSGAGAGRYPAKDEAARNDVILRLSESMKTADLKGADTNGFDFGAFLKAVVEATPVELATAGAPPKEAGVRKSDGDLLDAAFANPKAGGPVPLPFPGEAASLEDLLSGPAMMGPGFGEEIPRVSPRAESDLSYETETASPFRVLSGLAPIPMMALGALVLFGIVTMLGGDPSTSSLVSR